MRMLTPTQTRQPAGPALIDWSNPITRGLVEGINGRTGTYLTRPALLVPAASNSRGTKPTAQGVAYYNFGDNSPLLPRAISGSRTLMVLAVAPGLTTGGVLPATCGHVVNSLTHHITDTDGTTAGLIRGHFYVNGGFRVFGGSFTVPTGEIYSAVNRHIQGVGQSLWVNGALDPATGAFTGAALDNAAYGAYGANNTDRYVLLSLLWNRALTDAEVVSISRNPWQVFRAPSRMGWVFEAGGAPGAITGDSSATFSLTGDAAGSVLIAGASSGTFDLTGTATAVTEDAITGQSSGTFTLTGTASAVAIIAGQSSGTFDLTGTAASAVIVQAQSSGTFALTGTATAEVVPLVVNGESSGTFTLSGGATGTTGGASQATGGYWYEEQRKMWEWAKKKPTIKEVVEYVEEKPAEALKVAKQVAPAEVAGINTRQLRNNAEAAEFVAKQLMVAIELRRVQVEIEADEDDIESLLLLM